MRAAAKQVTAATRIDDVHAKRAPIGTGERPASRVSAAKLATLHTDRLVIGVSDAISCRLSVSLFPTGTSLGNADWANLIRGELLFPDGQGQWIQRTSVPHGKAGS